MEPTVTPAHQHTRRLPNDKLIFLSLLVILLLRLASVAIMGLMPQDAYYAYVYGDHLSLSYFDHPPLIGYLLRLSTSVFGKTVFAIKIADTIVTALTVFAFYKLARCFLSPSKAGRSLVILFSTFMVTILSLVSTPDVPLMLFWCLSLIMLHHAVFLEKKIYWLWSGLMMGLAFDSKYTGLLLPAGLILFLICSKAHRKKLLSVHMWASLLIFVIMIVPVIVWNVRNHFASFRFQSEERMQSIGGLQFTPLNFAGVVGHQSAILTPILFFALVVFLFKAFRKYILKRQEAPAATLFLLCFFIPTFVGFAAVSFFYWVKINWLMPAYLTGIILIARYYSEKWLKYQVVFSLVIHLALAVEIFFYPVQIRSDDTWFGWPALASSVSGLKKKDPNAFVFSADQNKTSSILSFYADSLVFSQNIIGENALHFDYIGPDLSTLEGKNAFFINSVPGFKSEGRENQFPETLPSYFNSVRELDPILIKKNGRTMRKFLVFYCTGYHQPKKRPAPSGHS